MIFYKIELLGVPKIVFACSVSVENHKNEFRCEKDFLEIFVQEGGQTVFKFDDGTVSYSNIGDCSLVTQDFACRAYSQNCEVNKHTTVGVKVKYNHEKINSENVNIEELRESVKNRTILIPFHYPLGEYAKPFSEKIKRIIRKFGSGNPTDSISAVAAWYEMAAYISAFTIRELTKSEISPAVQRYLDKAQNYISEHFAENIGVGDVANYLGISDGYLYHIFQIGMASGVTEYINKCKVEAVKQYIKSRSVSLKEAAMQVGIDDPAYMSRLFKKVTGISFRQYRQNCLTENI